MVFFSAEAMTGLLDGLEQIAKDTSNRVRGNDKDGVIALRAAAASLAFALHRHCRDAGLDEPEAIRTWRERCSDPDEFSEIRNSWAVAEG
ncbi:MAG: hypothetical protein F4X40_03700 [Chloroflexi bacterium]|nr:hypothetical protein [Chloroflexota bacterium]